MGGKKKSEQKKNKTQKSSGQKNKKKDIKNANKKKSIISKEETEILSELRMRIRSLLTCMQGVAPDGSPFSIEQSDVHITNNSKRKGKGYQHDGTINYHPLSSLLDSVFSLTERLISVQRKLKLEHYGGNESNKSVEEFSDESRDRSDKWKRFSEWLEDCQICPKVNNFPIKIQKSENTKAGYGIYATRDILYGEQILEIPVPAMISPYWDHMSVEEEKPPKPPPFDPSKGNEQGLQQLSLITFLMNEKWRGNESKFYPYIDCLPQSYSTLLYWSLDGIRELQITSYFKRAVAQIAITMWDYLRIRDQLEELHKNADAPNIIPPTPDFTYELFRWATATVHTRQNMIPYVSENDLSGNSPNVRKTESHTNVQNALALVPLWDLINHEESERACLSEVLLENYEVISDQGSKQILSKKRGLLRCRTPILPKDKNETDICFQRGEEIKMYYGERTNAQLLFQSGFVYCHAKCLDTSENSEQNSVQLDDSPGQLDEYSNGKNKVSNYHVVNLNKSDVAVLRLALPFSKYDNALHRVREMIAARYGFKFYVNQNCSHDGLLCARIASEILSEDTSQIIEASGHIEDEKDFGSVVMEEFSLQPDNPCPPAIRRAIILCIANREELNHLLKNMDRYTTISTDDKSWKGLQLNNKHLHFIRNIVQMCVATKTSHLENDFVENRNFNNFWIRRTEAKEYSMNLAACEMYNLKKWFSAFEKVCESEFSCTGDVKKKITNK